MSASDIAERLKARHAYEAKHYPPPDDLWLQAAAEIISLRADIAGLEDGNMTWMCDQLDKAKAENTRMREALGIIAEGSAPPIPHGHYLAHRHAVSLARVALSVKAG